MNQVIHIPIGTEQLTGDLNLVESPIGTVLFVHGSGSSRHSPRNKQVASYLNQNGFNTLLIDLLIEREDLDPQARFNIKLLSDRVNLIIKWMLDQKNLKSYPLFLFGASTGAASAMNAAFSSKGLVKAVVSRGGRVDMASIDYQKFTTPILMIVGELDDVVINLNRDVYNQLKGDKSLEIVKGATHLFEEPGCMEQVEKLALEFFKKHRGK